MASVGLLMVALGSALVYVALHGGLDLNVTPSTAAPIVVQVPGSNGGNA